MNQTSVTRTLAAAAALIGLGIISFLAWNLEASLNNTTEPWFSWFHYSVPVCVVLFLLWLVAFLPLDGIRIRLAFLVTAGVISLIWHQVFISALYFRVMGGPSAFLLVMTYGEIGAGILQRAIFLVLPLTPLVFAILLRAFRLRPTGWNLVLGCVVFATAFPMSFLLLKARGIHPGILHAIKTGMVIPFLVVGLGLPAIGATRRAKRSATSPLPDTGAGQT